MPTYNITDPTTGKQIQVTGDSPPTEVELEQIFASVQAPVTATEQPAQPVSMEQPSMMQQLTSPVGAVGALGPLAIPASLYKAYQEYQASPEVQAQQEQFFASLSPERRKLLESISPVEAAAIGFGSGLKRIGRAVGIGEADQTEQQAMELLKQQHPLSTGGGEIAGEAAPFVPLGLTAGAIRQAALRVPAMAGVGAAETGAIARGEGRSVKEQIMSAGLGGAVAGTMELAMPVIGRIAGRAFRKLTGKAPSGAVIDATGQPSKEFVDALAESGQSLDDIIQQAQTQLKGKVVDPQQAARKAFLESQGIDPTKAQITRNADDFMMQQEAAKSSTAVREALEKQDAALTTRFNNRVLESGGRTGNQAASVFDAITEKATVLDQEISDLYRAARETMPDKKNIRFENLAKTLRAVFPADRRTGGNVKAVIGDMQAKQIFDKKGKLIGSVNVEVAEDLRKYLNELYDEKNPFGNMVLRKLKDALDDDVFSAAGQDYFKQARSAKATFEKELNRAKVSKFDARKDNLVRDILENKVDPDQIVDKVVFSKRWRPDDLQQLKDYISTDEAGKAAFDDLRTEVLEKLRDSTFTGPMNQAGQQSMNVSGLEKQLAKMGAKKRHILFTPEENKFLDDMIQVAKLRQPVAGTALGYGPSAQSVFRAYAKLERKLKDIPGFGKLFDIIDVEGRKALVAKPKALPKLPTPAEARALIPPAAAGAAATQQEQ